MRAIVLGATGAIGREVVASLAALTHISSVVAVSRSKIDTTDDTQLQSKFPNLDLAREDIKSKVLTVALDWEDFTTKKGEDGEKPLSFEGAGLVAWCLGTTKSDAGSSEAFRRIDYDYCEAAATAAKKAGVPHFSLVSSMGANPRSFFLYPEVKGKVEELVKEKGFKTTSIYQPGILDRGDKLRKHEKVLVRLFGGTKVSDVAKVIADHSVPGVVQEGTTTYSDKEIRAAAKEMH
mmetsp:Transcript_40008/g.58838  ORF Transcript_40008/g.58838 Transcript_40008/m.58838 type:complete len:235 (-) Transcript_40008:426-1130(-)|eukprot:CAMPEP_0195507904 /NCGR_PEP_ID=MMETSP0794_2-20130614/1256_1 /TAXON_ID=515487 /ORGANISM="Stephanopyxis turris, Strain CCMP 815" /LENGTH=234 /DNA_ID=CAMNT_0040634735 /DNA_START=21 /DNA_END=725 /DNA_ORIENTATION=-